MSRLPISGGDTNTWGDILNDFLLQAHNPDGTLQDTGIIAAKADDNSVIHNSGDETIAGVKSFSSSPIVPTPTSGIDATNKTYVDNAVLAGASDASTTVKGITKLSTVPANAANPIAAGDNDPRLSDSRNPSGVAGGVLSGTYPNPGFAVDMATQAELDVEASTRASADALLIPKSLMDAKGDLIAATANDAPTRVSVGADGTVLTASAMAEAGVAWTAPPATINAATTIIDESFSGALTGVTADSGSSLTGLTTAGGVLGSSDANNHQFHSTSLNVTDAKHIVKINGLNGANHTVGLIFKYIDDSNSWFAQMLGGTVYIYKLVAGVYTQLSSMSYPATISPLWLVCRVSGNSVQVEVWAGDPRLKAIPYALTTNPPGVGGVSATLSQLTTTGITTLGVGVPGKPGLRLTGNGGAGATTVTLDDWIVATPVPTTVRNEF